MADTRRQFLGRTGSLLLASSLAGCGIEGTLERAKKEATPIRTSPVSPAHSGACSWAPSCVVTRWSPVTFASIRFEMPRKLATNAVRGRS